MIASFLVTFLALADNRPGAQDAAPAPAPVIAAATQGMIDKAEKGDAAAMVLVGRLYEKGRGCPQDNVKALQWFARAAAAGHVLGLVECGRMHETGLGTHQDYVAAAAYYNKALSSGSGEAAAALGNLHLVGLGVRRDEKTAKKLFATAAIDLQKRFADGDPSASLALGRLYMEGQGVPLDYAQALQIFKKGWEVSDEECGWNLAQFHLNGYYVKKNVAEGLKILVEAADSGSLSAARQLSSIYAQGRSGVAPDASAALKWQHRLADLGDPGSLYRLGKPMFEQPRDDAEQAKGFAMLVRAADQNHVDALYLAGRTLTIGVGRIAPAPEKGMRYLRAAAALGSREASVILNP
ncbi:MAG: hypothetical protein RL095_2898 [Verrucomicrobiota bacterium]|jgi:TPR repeat protein